MFAWLTAIFSLGKILKEMKRIAEIIKKLGKVFKEVKDVVRETRVLVAKYKKLKKDGWTDEEKDIMFDQLEKILKEVEDIADIFV